MVRNLRLVDGVYGGGQGPRRTRPASGIHVEVTPAVGRAAGEEQQARWMGGIGKASRDARAGLGWHRAGWSEAREKSLQQSTLMLVVRAISAISLADKATSAAVVRKSRALH